MRGKALCLYLARFYYPSAYAGTVFRTVFLRHLFEGDGDDFYLDINAVQQRSGDAVQVALHLSRVADTGPRWVIVISAWAWVHAGHQHKTGGIVQTVFGA